MELDFVIVGAIAGMIAIANPTLNPFKPDSSTQTRRAVTWGMTPFTKYRKKKLGDAKTHLHTVRDSIEFYADDQSQHEKCSWLCVHAF